MSGENGSTELRSSHCVLLFLVCFGSILVCFFAVGMVLDCVSDVWNLKTLRQKLKKTPRLRNGQNSITLRCAPGASVTAGNVVGVPAEIVSFASTTYTASMEAAPSDPSSGWRASNAAGGRAVTSATMRNAADVSKRRSSFDLGEPIDNS